MTQAMALEVSARSLRIEFELTVPATIYTSDIPRALRVASKIESGAVGVNQAFKNTPQVPFGGVKQSGYGRESGYEGLRGYLHTKTISINMEVKSQ